MFVVKNAEGEVVAGDGVADTVLQARADEIGGTIEDEETGEVVYPLPK